MFVVVIVGVVAAFETDHQTACFRIEAAQRTCRLDPDVCLGIHAQDTFFQRLSCCFIHAVGDADLAAFVA